MSLDRLPTLGEDGEDDLGRKSALADLQRQGSLGQLSGVAGDDKEGDTIRDPADYHTLHNPVAIHPSGAKYTTATILYAFWENTGSDLPLRPS